MNENKFLEFEKRLQSDKIKKSLLEKDLEQTQSKIDVAYIESDNLLKARAIAQIVAKETQQKLEFHISNIVSMALSSIFPEPYKFSLRFIERRNKSEADFILSKGGEEIDDLMSSVGGGVIDIISFALRCSIWSLKKTRNVIILDEPFRFLSRDLQGKASVMMKKISEKLNLQFIIVSHIPEIIECADKVIDLDEQEIPLRLKRRRK